MKYKHLKGYIFLSTSLFCHDPLEQRHFELLPQKEIIIQELRNLRRMEIRRIPEKDQQIISKTMGSYETLETDLRDVLNPKLNRVLEEEVQEIGPLSGLSLTAYFENELNRVNRALELNRVNPPEVEEIRRLYR